MTNSLKLSRSDDTDGIHDPDTLLASIPGLLGFVPERSIVFVAFRADRMVAATMRHDLDLTPGGAPTPGMRRLFAQLGSLAESYGVVATVAVVIDDRYPPGDGRYRKLAKAVDRGFRPAGGLNAAFAMASATSGAPWCAVWLPDGRRERRYPFVGSVLGSGVLSDPSASATALERAVSSGRRILPKRSDLTALLAPAPHCANPELCQANSPDPRRHAPDRDDDRALAVMLAVVDRFEAGDTELTCGELNEIAEALVSVHVRDALLGLSMTYLRGTVEDLWRVLTRRLTGSSRAAAATLLGYLHYMAGEGAYAGVAFGVALEADPDYNLAHLLDTALAHGMRPANLSGLAELAYEVAENLGAHLPPPEFEAAG